MVVYKRKKNTRQRAHTTHGYGSMKKNRGAGHRGGRGRAGSGKRGDVKKPSLMWKKGHKHKGRVGFKTYNQEVISPINLSFIEKKIIKLVDNKIAEKKGDTFVIDLKKIKHNKLLGTGKVTYKYEITVDYASSKAIEKIEKAGGKVILPKVDVVAKEEAEPEKTASEE